MYRCLRAKTMTETWRQLHVTILRHREWHIHWGGVLAGEHVAESKLRLLGGVTIAAHPPQPDHD